MAAIVTTIEVDRILLDRLAGVSGCQLWVVMTPSNSKTGLGHRGRACR